MPSLEGIELIGGGEQTTVETRAVRCPDCGEPTFTAMAGQVTCDSCETTFSGDSHIEAPCRAIICDSCDDPLPLGQDYRFEIAQWDAYLCDDCMKLVAVDTDSGIQQPAILLETEWVLNGESPEVAGNRVSDTVWAKRVETRREQAAVDLLNHEIRRDESGWRAYNADTMSAHLCFDADLCLGYIMWHWEGDTPELGQLFILPTAQRQGIGSGFVEAWREDVVPADQLYTVNNPNENMLRLLRGIGTLELRADQIEFTECRITGQKRDIPEEWQNRGP
ncbi:GNAT family N-acetyltransferase [Halomarina ordinaria]|uniref:GNAT family N-acetyltransferase n=1 Tax=Halomarina ordinaria TaxID=3033939 RepID=A0ABD5UCZ2_9EURY|nr:GNAT family N-acetyltransferase [Halomarina sp. PSRA2]